MHISYYENNATNYAQKYAEKMQSIPLCMDATTSSTSATSVTSSEV